MTALDDLVPRVKAAAATRGGPWTLAQTLSHCAQSIEYSLTGYPKDANVVVRKIFGPMVMRKFLRNGAMKHDLGAAIPGAPALDDDVEHARARLLAAIASFAAASATKPHFAYGPVSHADYARLHAMHLVDHFG